MPLSNSFFHQIFYYDELIKCNKNWTFVQGYTDEGLSGISTKKRENFHQMVRNGKNGEFDLVITKEITRFARNSLDSISCTRELLATGVGVFFQNDNINTLDEDRLLIFYLRYIPCYKHARSSGLRQPARYSGAVASAVQTADLCHKTV